MAAGNALQYYTPQAATANEVTSLAHDATDAQNESTGSARVLIAHSNGIELSGESWLEVGDPQLGLEEGGISILEGLPYACQVRSPGLISKICNLVT